jgi:hypothetical protein
MSRPTARMACAQYKSFAKRSIAFSRIISGVIIGLLLLSVQANLMQTNVESQNGVLVGGRNIETNGFVSR